MDRFWTAAKFLVVDCQQAHQLPRRRKSVVEPTWDSSLLCLGWSHSFLLIRLTVSCCLRPGQKTWSYSKTSPHPLPSLALPRLPPSINHHSTLDPPETLHFSYGRRPSLYCQRTIQICSAPAYPSTTTTYCKLASQSAPQQSSSPAHLKLGYREPRALTSSHRRSATSASKIAPFGRTGRRADTPSNHMHTEPSLHYPSYDSTDPGMHLN